MELVVLAIIAITVFRVMHKVSDRLAEPQWRVITSDSEGHRVSEPVG